MTTAPHVDRRMRREAAGIAGGLFEHHSRMVYGICRAMLRDVHDAEDTTQQVFLSAYEALLRGAGVRDSGAWLATIARNECRRRIAAGMRRPLPVADEDLDAFSAPGDEGIRRSQAQELRAALAELPARQREAVVLRYLYGLRYTEVATALGLSRPATEALLFRARRAMRLRLRPVVGAALVVPSMVRDELALALPGFGAGAGEGAAATSLAGSLLVKVMAGPLGLKAATAVVALSTVGVVGAVPQERAGNATTERTVAVGRGEGEADVSSRPARQVENVVKRDLADGPSSHISRTTDNDRPGRTAPGGTSGGEGRTDADPGGPTSSGPGSPEDPGPTPESEPGPVTTDDPPTTGDGGSSGPSGSSGPGSGTLPGGSEAVVTTESSEESGSGTGESGSSASGSGSGESGSPASASGSDSSGSGSDTGGPDGRSTSGRGGDSGSGSGSGSVSSEEESGH